MVRFSDVLTPINFSFLKRMKRLLLIFGLFCLCMLYGKAQIDTSFWFAAPDLTSGHQQTPIRFCVASFEEPATITFEQPANPNYTPHVITLPANSFHSYDISSMIATVETQPINTVVNYGFHIHSSANITTYYEVVGNDSEIFSLKGRNALGIRFVVPMQFSNNSATNYTPLPYPSIEIVATEDNTQVTIIPSVDLKDNGGLAGIPFTITLNRGQSYAIQSASGLAAQHLGNTVITSNHPIAVNSTDDSVLQTGKDLVADQILPVDFAGKIFIPIWNEQSYEHVFFFPVDTEHQTSIYINGSPAPTATLNYGSSYMYNLNQNATLITSDYPIEVFQLTGTHQEVGGTVLPQLECTGSKEVVYSRPPNSLATFITIVVKTDFISNFLFNGNTSILTANDFHYVPADSSWSFCRKDVANHVPINDLMKIKNTMGYFHLGIIDTSAPSCSYGFFSDYQNYSRLAFNMSTDPHYCIGDTIYLNYSCNEVENISVSGPNNYYSEDSVFVIPVTSDNQAGYYIITGNSIAGCGNVLSDSVYIRISAPSLEIEHHESCDSLTWIDGHTYYETTNTPAVIYQTSQGCDSIRILNLTIHHSSETNLSEVICEGKGYYQHGFSISPTETINKDSLERYLYLQSAFGCDSAVHAVFTITDTFLQIISSSEDFCENNYLDLIAISNYSNILWNTGETDNQIHVTTPGLYTVTVTDGQCTSTASYHIKPCESVIHLPNAITPINYDGLNDYFGINEVQQALIKDDDFLVVIYDRWGVLVYQSDDKSFRWDGKINGRVLGGNIYAYRIVYKDLNNCFHSFLGTVITL